MHQRTKLESEIQAQIVAAMEDAGWYVVKLIQTSKNGMPDLLCHRAGRTLYIEVKRPQGACTMLQLHRHRELYTAGVPVYVITSLNGLILNKLL